jgi:hypothetical protein
MDEETAPLVGNPDYVFLPMWMKLKALMNKPVRIWCSNQECGWTGTRSR